MNRISIKNAFIFTMTGEGLGTIEKGFVNIEGNKIIDVDPSKNDR